jgi:hypothetical protein
VVSCIEVFQSVQLGLWKLMLLYQECSVVRVNGIYVFLTNMQGDKSLIPIFLQQNCTRRWSCTICFKGWSCGCRNALQLYRSIYFLGTFAKFLKATVGFIMSIRLFVCPSAWNSSPPTGWIVIFE